MTPAPRWHLPPDLLALIARFRARRPRPVQRAEYRARMLARAEANYRRARREPGPDGPPPIPPAGVS